MCAVQEIFEMKLNLCNSSFENISEQEKRDDAVSENGSSSVDDDNSMSQIN